MQLARRGDRAAVPCPVLGAVERDWRGEVEIHSVLVGREVVGLGRRQRAADVENQDVLIALREEEQVGDVGVRIRQISRIGIVGRKRADRREKQRNKHREGRNGPTGASFHGNHLSVVFSQRPYRRYRDNFLGATVTTTRCRSTRCNAASSTAPVRRSFTPEGSSTSIVPPAG